MAAAIAPVKTALCAESGLRNAICTSSCPRKKGRVSLLRTLLIRTTRTESHDPDAARPRPRCSLLDPSRLLCRCEFPAPRVFRRRDGDVAEANARPPSIRTAAAAGRVELGRAGALSPSLGHRDEDRPFRGERTAVGASGLFSPMVLPFDRFRSPSVVWCDGRPRRP